MLGFYLFIFTFSLFWVEAAVVVHIRVYPSVVAVEGLVRTHHLLFFSAVAVVALPWLIPPTVIF